MIRKAVKRDVDALASVITKTYQATYADVAPSNDWLRLCTEEFWRPIWKSMLAPQYIKTEGPIFVAEHQGTVVGYVTGRWIGNQDYYRDLPMDAFAELEELYILPEHQRSTQHFGSALLSQLARTLPTNRRVVGHVASGNARMREYLRHLNPEREDERGSLVLFRRDAVVVEVPKVSFYWRRPADLLGSLERRGPRQ